MIFHISTHSDSGMVMTLQLTRMVVMMAKPNMGWVKTIRAIRRTGWNGERSQRAFVAENLRFELIFSVLFVLFYFEKESSDLKVLAMSE